MELKFPSFPIICTIILLLFMVVMKTKRSQTRSACSKLPPGPWKLPIIGNLHQLLLGLPHHSLKDLAQKHGPLMHIQLGDVSAIVISSATVAKEVMKTHDLSFVDRHVNLVSQILSYGNKGIAFAPYGDYWRQLRKICILELLSAKRVRSFGSIREDEVSNLIQRVMSMAGSSINMSERIRSLTNDITSKVAFGKQCKDSQTFLSAMAEIVKLSSGFDLCDIFPSRKYFHVIGGTKQKLEKLHQKIDMIFSDIIKEHTENRTTSNADIDDECGEDLVDVLLRLQDGGKLSVPFATDNIKAVMLDIFTAGSETSSTAIEWAMSEIIRNPRIMKKVQSEVRQVVNGKRNVVEVDVHELNYLKQVIKEVLRLHPPFPLLLPRECREKCEINGYEIPVKTKVIVNAWAIGRDPEHWRNAESFEPERFEDGSIDYKGMNFEYIPFGAGRRICPGILFGAANIELPLAQLLYHFDWKLPDGLKPEELDMTESFGGSARKKNDLYLILIPHSPLTVE